MARDKLHLEGMVFYGHHGVDPCEQKLGQRLVVDIEVERDLASAGGADDPSLTVDYTLLYRLAKEVVEGPSRQLIESVAETIAGRVLQECDVEAVTVRVKKPEPPIKGSVLAHAGVEIYRER